jgi:hypothetical protein
MDKLKKYLSDNQLTEQEVIDRLDVQQFDPAKDFYATLVSASKQLMDSVKSKEIDLDDPYYKALFQILQAGDKINKSLKLAKLEAYPDEETTDGNVSFMDRQAGKRK